MGEPVVDAGPENIGARDFAKAGYPPQADIRRVTVEAVADTGAVMLALPEDVALRLGVAVMTWWPLHDPHPWPCRPSARIARPPAAADGTDSAAAHPRGCPRPSSDLHNLH